MLPDDKDAQTGFSSYRYNVSICPQGGNYLTGSKKLSVYETETEYYSPYNFEVHEVDVVLAVMETA